MKYPLHTLTALLMLVLTNQTVLAASQLLEEITVRGEMEPPTQESLTVREVRESPARDMGEALKQIEGVSSVRKGAIANDVVLRGFQKDNINVLVDGTRIHGACPSRMDPPSFHLDFAEISEIKVLKGPYDVSNPGSLGGMIDARTKQPGKGFNSDFNVTYGSFDRMDGSVTASYGNNRLDGLLGYAYKRSGVPKAGNGSLITDIYPSTSANRYRADTIDSRAYEINTGWTKFGLKPTDNSRMEVGYTYQDADHVLYPYLRMDAEYDRTQRLNWSYRIEKVSPVVKEVNLQAYWNQVKHLMDDRLRASSTPSATVTRIYSMQTDAETRMIGLKANGSFAVGDGTLKSGIDYYNRNWDALNMRAMYTPGQAYSPLNMIPDVFVDNLGLFAEYEIPFADKFIFKAGLRGDLTWIETDKGNPLVAEGTDTDFAESSGNVQLTYTPVTGLELFTGFGRGIRTPDPQELYISLPAMAPAITWRGNPGLQPTINYQADVGAKYAATRFYVNASVFHSWLQDYINFYSESATAKSYQNIDATMWGSELGTQISLPYDLFVKGTLSYVEGKNRDGNRPLSEIPPLSGSVGLRYDNGTAFCELIANMAREQDRVDSGLNEQRTPGWATTDLKAGVIYKSLSLYAGVYNLLDKHYYSHLSYLRDPFASGTGFKVPENGRNFYANITYTF